MSTTINYARICNIMQFKKKCLPVLQFLLNEKKIILLCTHEKAPENGNITRAQQKNSSGVREQLAGITYVATNLHTYVPEAA
jgi:hypothetical protein